MITARIKPRPRLKAVVTRPYQGKGYTEGYEAGQKEEYDRFWDTFQDYGNKVAYSNCFANNHWDDDTYNPKYDIVCEGGSNATNLFYNTNKITNTKKPIRVRNTVLTGAFTRDSALEIIPLLELNGVTGFSQTFTGCTKLRHVIIGGSIDVNFNISAAADLDEESRQSIVNALKDLTGQTQQTLTIHNTVGSKLTAEQKASITAKNWTLVY